MTLEIDVRGPKRTYYAATMGVVACFAMHPVAFAKPGQDAQANNPTDSSYRINPGDELEIYVWGEERLQRTVRVLPDGTIAFPLAGQMQVQGKLPQDLEKMLSERLGEQYRNQVPQITVTVKTPSGLQFSVLGKVRAPGAFSPGRYVNVLEALSLAGGPAEFANLDGVMLIRKQGAQLTVTRVRLSPLFKSGASASDVDRAAIPRIETGDTLIVP